MPHPADPALVPAVAPADHAAHDRVLVAAYAAGDATGTELEAATALVAACTACAALHHDLRLIAASLTELPAPRRARDFRLTPQQAASLRPAGWRRLLAPFAGPRFAFAGPLGSGLAALGIAGILLAGTGLPLGGATSGDAPAEAPLAAGSPTVEDGSVGIAAASAAPAPEVQGPVTAPEGSAGIAAPVTAPAGGMSAAGTDKNAAPGVDASPAATAGAVAGAFPAELPVASAPAAAPSGEAVRAAGARDRAVVPPANMLLLLAAAMAVAGVIMAGLRVVSRRVA